MGEAPLHVETSGESGEEALLVMGFGMPGNMWAPMLPPLAARHRVAVFDHRGLGRSPDPARSRMSELVDDTLSVLDGLGWSRVHLVGVSMGGMIAQELTLRCPERVRTLSLVATHAGGPLALLPPLPTLLAMLAPQPRARRLQRLLHPPGVRLAMEARTRSMLDIRRGPGTALAHLRAVRGHDTRARLRELAVPTLVVKPGLDAMIRPSHSDALARRIPGARLVELPSAGHGLIAHAADELSALLLDHWAAPAPAGD